MKSSNKYDYLLILLISILIFGYYGSPLYPSRLLALAISPMVLKGVTREDVYIPSFVKTFLGIWIFFGCLSLLWSYDRTAGFRAIFYSFCNIISFFSFYICGLRACKPIRSMLVGWLILFLLTVPIAILEFTTGTHLSIAFQDETLSMIGVDGVRIQRVFASVTYGNLNKYNVIVCFCLPYLLSSILYFRNKTMHIVLMVTLLLLIYVIMMNASRGAFICMLLSFVVFSYFMFKQKTNVYIYFFVICLACVVFVNADVFMGQMLDRFENSNLGNDEERTKLYSFGISALIETLGFGVGIGGVNAGLASISGYRAAMHNMFLEFLVQFGLIPFVFYLRFLYGIYMGLWRNKIHYAKILGGIFILTALPLFIINSNYLMDTDLWIFFGSAFAIMMISK